jgi:YgiT-type zinc finger domain-containing protein
MISRPHICPYCQDGIIEERTYADWRDVGNGISMVISDLRVGICDTCHSETVTAEMHDHNLNLIMTESMKDDE